MSILIRLEWVAAAIGCVVAFRWLDGGWGLFALLILAPDLAMVGYAFGPRIGALCYNAVHTTLGPAVLALAAVVFGPAALKIALIWVTHIAVDRALGYGLKLPSGFRDTHPGRVGHDRAAG
ncbi:MAG: DUF4260 domain-containing protein [Rhizobiaceae bacterium]|nr:DUF4260 domain-containing protein [Rhizobiaceae bacterium]